MLTNCKKPPASVAALVRRVPPRRSCFCSWQSCPPATSKSWTLHCRLHAIAKGEIGCLAIEAFEHLPKCLNQKNIRSKPWQHFHPRSLEPIPKRHACWHETKLLPPAIPWCPRCHGVTVRPSGHGQVAIHWGFRVSTWGFTWGWVTNLHLHAQCATVLWILLSWSLA